MIKLLKYGFAAMSVFFLWNVPNSKAYQVAGKAFFWTEIGQDFGLVFTSVLCLILLQIFIPRPDKRDKEIKNLRREIRKLNRLK